MAWTKDVYFLLKTEADWTSQNPVLPVGSIVGVQTATGGLRLKLGDGNRYVDTSYVGQEDIEKRFLADGDGTEFVKSDGTTAPVDTLSIQEIIDAGYHLVTDAEWSELQKYSLPAPSFVATPQFDVVTVKEIGDAIAGAYQFNFSKTNNANFKDVTGGNIVVDQGSWTGVGDFDLKNSSSKTITAASFTLPSAGTLRFTLKGRDSFDQEVSLQTTEIQFQYPVWGGTKADKLITTQNDLSNLVKRVGASADGMEFYLDPNGSLHYFHLLVPTEITNNIDFRDLSAPGPGSGNMEFQGNVTLNVGIISKQYSHYVTNFQSAAQVDFLIKILD